MCAIKNRATSFFSTSTQENGGVDEKIHVDEVHVFRIVGRHHSHVCHCCSVYYDSRRRLSLARVAVVVRKESRLLLGLFYR